MGENGPALVAADAFGHHVQYVVHDTGAQIEVKVTLHALLGDVLGKALGVTALKLACQQISKPALEQRNDASQKEEPHTPSRRPHANTGALAHRSSVEAVVDQMLEVLAGLYLSHQPVLVPVHAAQLPHMRKGVLQSARQLVAVDVAEAVLHVGVNDKLGESDRCR